MPITSRDNRNVKEVRRLLTDAGYRRKTGRFAIYCDIDYGTTLLPMGLRRRFDGLRKGDAALLQKLAIAGQNFLAVAAGPNPAPRQHLKLFNMGKIFPHLGMIVA